MQYAFKDVPEPARIMWDRAGAVWVKVGGAWKCAADPDADPRPGALGGVWEPETMASFGPFTVIDVDPPAPTVGIQKIPAKGSPVNLGPGIYRVTIVEGHAEFGLWGV